jgi:hypothetical protein
MNKKVSAKCARFVVECVAFSKVHTAFKHQYAAATQLTVNAKKQDEFVSPTLPCTPCSSLPDFFTFIFSLNPHYTLDSLRHLLKMLGFLKFQYTILFFPLPSLFGATCPVGIANSLLRTAWIRLFMATNAFFALPFPPLSDVSGVKYRRLRSSLAQTSNDGCPLCQVLLEFNIKA